MNLTTFLGWITETDYITVMSFSDNTLRAYVETESLYELQELFRGMFAHRLSDDFIKLSSGRYYFTIKFEASL